MKIVVALLIVAFAYLADLSVIFAAEIPNFTSCVNPQGEVIASYDSGTHGIAGKPGLFEGKDSVYKVSGNAITQCFCATDGSGIQTNFWKTPQLSESEIKTYEAQDWIYIPNGMLWGLDDSAYLAKNSDFSCKSSEGSSGSNGGNGGSSSSLSNSSSSNGSSAASGVGQVLGMASTGNVIFFLGTALTSGLSLVIGLILKKRTNIFSK